MSTIDQYKDEAMRLLDHYPLEACERVSARLNGRGWTLRQFDVKVEIFESIKWRARVVIKTDVTGQTIEEKQRELFAVLELLDLKPTLFKAGEGGEVETVRHRKYGIDENQVRRVVGHWYEFNLEFTPLHQIELSVLTEEET
jgi:hypothetical protein